MASGRDCCTMHGSKCTGVCPDTKVKSSLHVSVCCNALQGASRLCCCSTSFKKAAACVTGYLCCSLACRRIASAAAAALSKLQPATVALAGTDSLLQQVCTYRQNTSNLAHAEVAALFFLDGQHRKLFNEQTARLWQAALCLGLVDDGAREVLKACRCGAA